MFYDLMFGIFNWQHIGTWKEVENNIWLSGKISHCLSPIKLYSQKVPMVVVMMMTMTMMMVLMTMMIKTCSTRRVLWKPRERVHCCEACAHLGIIMIIMMTAMMMRMKMNKMMINMMMMNMCPPRDNHWMMIIMIMITTVMMVMMMIMMTIFTGSLLFLLIE